VSRQKQSPRKYPRSARVNEIVREVLAEELERMNDPRLSMVTVTGVDVAPDLRQARVYYAALGREDDEVVTALRAAAPHLRAVLGREVRLKYLPRLEFHLDPAIEQGQRVEDIIRTLHAEE
jgi:ribosome-binding factor A